MRLFFDEHVDLLRAVSAEIAQHMCELFIVCNADEVVFEVHELDFAVFQRDEVESSHQLVLELHESRGNLLEIARLAVDIHL